MEAPEVPTEHLTEEIHEHAHESKEKWLSFVALSTALIAALAAIASLMAGKFDTEATLEQLKASDQWAFYQAKGIKAAAWITEIETLKALGNSADPKVVASTVNCNVEASRYKEEQKKIKAEAEADEVESRGHLRRHESLAASVTMFQIAIAVAAISVLMRRKFFFYISLGAAVIGIYFFAVQFTFSPTSLEKEESAAPPAAVEQPH